MSEDQNTETHAVADASIGAGTETTKKAVKKAN